MVACSSTGPAATTGNGEAIQQGSEGILISRVLRCTPTGWEVEVDGTVDIGKVDLEQNIPVLVVTAVLVEAVPPVPIAAFCNVQRFPRRRQSGVVGVTFLEVDQRLPGLNQALPGQTFLFFTRPCS